MHTPQHAPVEHARDLVRGHISERIARCGRSSRSYVRQIGINPVTLQAQLMHAPQHAAIEHARDLVGGHIGERIARRGRRPSQHRQICVDPVTTRLEVQLVNT